MIEQEAGKAVFLVDLFATPAMRAIKLDDHRRIVLDADLVDAVFVTVEGKDARVAESTGGFHRGDHLVRGQARIGMNQGWFNRSRMIRTFSIESHSSAPR